MNKYTFLSLFLLAATSCQRTVYTPVEPAARPFAVIEETYVHKYGFEVEPTEWQERGEHGKKITTLNNGVTATQSFNFGQLDGESTFTFPYSSNIERIQVYSKGALISDETRFMGNIPKKKIDYLSNDLRRVTMWYESGTPQMVEEQSNNRVVKGEYFTLNNQNESAVFDGNGIRTNRDSTGLLQSKDTIENGEMIERVSFYLNGTPKEMMPFKNGIVHGLRRTFMPGGEPSTVEEWQNGVQTGVTLIYQNGEKYAEVPYQNGVKSGLERRYRDGKDLFEEITWVDGVETGPSRTYKSFKK